MNIIKKILGQKNADKSKVDTYKLDPAASMYKKRAELLEKEVESLKKEVSLLQERNLSMTRNNVNSASQGKDGNKIRTDILFTPYKEADVYNKEHKEEDISDIGANVDKLQKEYTSMHVLYEKIGEEMTELQKQMDRMKIALSKCQKQYKDDYQIPEKPKESAIIVAEENIDDLDTTPPPIIIPKLLTIKGYEDYFNVIIRNLSTINFINETNKGFPSYQISPLKTEYDIAHLGNMLKDCGKEILLVKCDPIEKEESEENESIINTCKKINDLRVSGDKLGFEKFHSYFTRKYPQPKKPYGDEKPIDFIQDEYDSIYKSAFFLQYYLNAYYDTFKKESLQRYSRTWLQLHEVEINEVLVTLMNILNELLLYGYKICIAPILDENILYRPKSAAQDGDVYSLLFYDKYVEIPEMVKDEKKEPSLYSTYGSSSIGSTYVSGHYRSGHMRNGRWISGGYVKGHYRT